MDFLRLSYKKKGIELKNDLMNDSVDSVVFTGYNKKGNQDIQGGISWTQKLKMH
jgi:hypothetical protein